MGAQIFCMWRNAYLLPITDSITGISGEPVAEIATSRMIIDQYSLRQRAQHRHTALHSTLSALLDSYDGPQARFRIAMSQPSPGLRLVNHSLFDALVPNH